MWGGKKGTKDDTKVSDLRIRKEIWAEGDFRRSKSGANIRNLIWELWRLSCLADIQMGRHIWLWNSFFFLGAFVRSRFWGILWGNTALFKLLLETSLTYEIVILPTKAGKKTHTHRSQLALGRWWLCLRNHKMVKKKKGGEELKLLMLKSKTNIGLFPLKYSL